MRGCSISLGALLAFLVLTSSAAADAVIGSPGSGAGQIGTASAIAVDRTSNLLYVADSSNNRVDVFDATDGDFVRAFGWGVADGTTAALQTCTTTCFKGLAGSGAGQFDGPNLIAVDNNPASPAFHDVYVADIANNRVQRFTPAGAFVNAIGVGQFQTLKGLGVGPTGAVYVIDAASAGPCEVPGVDGNAFAKRVQKYTPAGAVVEPAISLTDAPCGDLRAFAVDSTGAFYVANAGGSGAVRKYSAVGVPAGAPYPVNPSFNIASIGLDASDNLYVGDHTDGAAIYEYTGGVPTRTFYGSDSLFLQGTVSGVAPFPNPPFPNANGDVFAADLSGARIVDISFPPPGPVVYPNPIATFASPIGSTKATLNSKINPEGKATTFQFEYISDADYIAAGETFGTGTVKTTSAALLGPVDFKRHDAQAAVAGLFPETVYHFRAVASNADGGPNIGPTVTFETKDPLEFGEAWTTEVGTDTATLHTEVNPLGILAVARFEYVDQTSFEESGYATASKAPVESAGAIVLGEGEAFKDGIAEAFDLEPGTTYRYRLIATNRCKPEPEPLCDFEGPEGTFSTFEPSLTAPGSCSNAAFRSGSAAFLPDCRAYEMVSPVDKNGSNIEPLANLSGFPAGYDQGAADGNSISYSTYKAFGNPASAPYTNQYLGRRSGTEGWLTEAISPKREGPSIMVYLSAQLDRQYKGFSDDLCSGWVVQDANPVLASNAPSGFGGLYRRDNCGVGTGSYEALTTVAPPNLSQEPRKFIPELQGVSADGTVGIFSVNDNLTSDAPPQPASCVNEAEACQPRLYEARGGELRFVCILPSGLPATGSCGAGTSTSTSNERGNSVLNAISADGSRIFWSAPADGLGKLFVRIDGATPTPETLEISSTPARFWAAAVDGSKAIYTASNKLFTYDVDTETSTEIAEAAGGVAGVSEDGSRIYFTSTKPLAAGSTEGQENLFLWEEGNGFQFVATLPSIDAIPGSPSPISGLPSRRLSRVTPDGEQLAFMSRGRLTGYDNTDAVSKQADAEVFIYDANANGGAGELNCASCNPSNARPEGRKLTQKLLETVWAAARIPTFESQLYGQRVLSDDGQRLYFNSFEALVARDTNGQEDVYQWQAVGSGTCTGTSSPTYSPPNGGCIDLISTGQSPQGSELVDIGTDARDVFIKTYSSLVEQDTGLLDIYDVRSGGGFPPLPPPPIVCVGEACQSPAPPPEDPTPSSTIVGPGNPPVPKPKPKPKKCPKGKHKVKRGGKVVCVKNKPKKKGAKKQSANKSGGADR